MTAIQRSNEWGEAAATTSGVETFPDYECPYSAFTSGDRIKLPYRVVKARAHDTLGEFVADNTARIAWADNAWSRHAHALFRVPLLKHFIAHEAFHEYMRANVSLPEDKTAPTAQNVQLPTNLWVSNSRIEPLLPVPLMFYDGLFGNGERSTLAGLAAASAEVQSLEDGWEGPGSLAPTEKVKSTVAALATALPATLGEPEVEVDGSDGTVTLRWLSDDDRRALALTCSRGDFVVGVLTDLDSGSQSWRWHVSEMDELIKVVTTVRESLDGGA